MSRKRGYTYTFREEGRPSFHSISGKNEQVTKNDLIDVIEKMPAKELKQLLLKMFVVEERNIGSNIGSNKIKRKTRRGKKRTRRK